MENGEKMDFEEWFETVKEKEAIDNYCSTNYIRGKDSCSHTYSEIEDALKEAYRAGQEDVRRSREEYEANDDFD